MADQYVRVQAAGKPATLAEARWEKRAEELSFSALESVRGTAAKWAGTIATLLAIFSVVTLVKGPEDVTKVEGSYGWASLETWVILLLGVAVALAAAATFLAALAAYGLPGDFRFVGSEVRRLHRRAATSAAIWLDLSWMLALGAIVSLALGVGITWLNTPDDAAVPSKTIVVTDAGVRACGKLLPSSGEQTIVILEPGQQEGTPIPAADITALGTIAACPAD